MTRHCDNCGKEFEYVPWPGLVHQMFYYCHRPECDADMKVKRDELRQKAKESSIVQPSRRSFLGGIVAAIVGAKLAPKVLAGIDPALAGGERTGIEFDGGTFIQSPLTYHISKDGIYERGQLISTQVEFERVDAIMRQYTTKITDIFFQPSPLFVTLGTRVGCDKFVGDYGHKEGKWIRTRQFKTAFNASRLPA